MSEKNKMRYLDAKTFWISCSIIVTGMLLNFTLLQLEFGSDIPGLQTTPLILGSVFIFILIIVYLVSLYKSDKDRKEK